MSIGKVALNCLKQTLGYVKANPIKAGLIATASIFAGHKFSKMNPDEKKEALFNTSMASVPFCVSA